MSLGFSVIAFPSHVSDSAAAAEPPLADSLTRRRTLPKERRVDRHGSCLRIFAWSLVAALI
jgi:hypothetical protein